MTDQNVCPVCGCKLEVGTYETMRTKLYVAVCTVCGTSGPIRGSWIGAKEALAHPAHLHTYNPATHIVVSREAGERVAKIIKYHVCGRENCKCCELAAELRAALEGRSEQD